MKNLFKSIIKFVCVVCVILTICSVVDRATQDGKLPTNNITLACGDLVDMAGEVVVDGYTSMGYVIDLPETPASANG